MSDPTKAIVQRLSRKLVVSLRAVGADADDPLEARAMLALADLVDAQVSWLDRRTIEDTIVTSRTIGMNGWRPRPEPEETE